MNRLIARLLPAAALPLPMAPPPSRAVRAAADAADAAARLALQGVGERHALAQAAVTTPAPSLAAGLAEPPAGCGWFDSSHELHQGLAVQEWPDADWAVAALYFGALQPSTARWQ